MKGQRIGIAGVGLIGGSIALRARAAGARVLGFDLDRAAAARALARGAVDEIVGDIATLAARTGTLVIALPVDAVGPALTSLMQVGGPELTIDVASVKAPLQRFAGLVPNYVGTHPMAGRERGGIDAADARLFEAATWAYVPAGDPALTARVRTFIAAMGARPLEVDAAAHDAIVAVTSHLPQALSVTLAVQVAQAIESDDRVMELCGPGMMTMLRLARSPAATWSPIVTANAEPLARHMRLTAQALATAADALEQGDTSLLMSYFEVARDVTGALEERYPSASRP